MINHLLQVYIDISTGPLSTGLGGGGGGDDWCGNVVFTSFKYIEVYK